MRLDQLYFRFSLVFLLILGGTIFGVLFEHFKFPPYHRFNDALSAVKTYKRYGELVPPRLISIIPEHASRDFFTIHKPDLVVDGYRLLLGYIKQLDDYGVQLTDSQGNVIKSFALNYKGVDPDGPTGDSDSPHAVQIDKQGNVYVNFDRGDYLVKYDLCGDVQWSREGNYHHSLDFDNDGNLWTWSGEISSFSQYQYLTEIDPETGETLSRIGLYEDIISSSDSNRALFGLLPGQELEHETEYANVEDIFHPNDIEIVSDEFAGFLPEVSPGDFIISLRDINLVAIVDHETYEILWHMQGPWVTQHDPDLRPDGSISVFDNNPRDKVSNIIIVKQENETNPTLSLVEVDEENYFFSEFQGKHNWINNDIVQVIVPGEGRVLEFTKKGELILEINNLFDSSHNANMSDAKWLPQDFFLVNPEKSLCA